jgi:hypothetical protein
MSCGYDMSRHVGLESELLVPGAFPVDAASQFALATAQNPSATTTVDGLGVKAARVPQPQSRRRPTLC